MNDMNRNVLILTLGLWVLIFVVTAVKIAKSELKARELTKFLTIVSAVALLKLACFFYLQQRIQNHTFSENALRLSYVLYPELPLALMIPTENYTSYVIISFASLLLGSFLWAFPILIFLSREKDKT